jgi:hypothetical protein
MRVVDRGETHRALLVCAPHKHACAIEFLHRIVRKELPPMSINVRRQREEVLRWVEETSAPLHDESVASMRRSIAVAVVRRSPKAVEELDSTRLVVWQAAALQSFRARRLYFSALRGASSAHELSPWHDTSQEIGIAEIVVPNAVAAVRAH